VRSLENLGGLLDLVVQDGANTFDGLSFSVQEQEALLARARADAVRDAIEKAEQLAIAAGVTLGPVLNISEGGNIPRPAMMEMAAARMADAVPIAAGEVSLSVQVNMSFGISDE
jgi:hypothetical protein